MNPLRARITALSLGMSIAVVGVVAAALNGCLGPIGAEPCSSVETECPPSDVLGYTDPRFDERERRVLEELGTSRANPWAGVYRTTGLWPTTFSVAPTAGFTVRSDSWCGNCDGWDVCGRVLSVDERKLELEVELTASGTNSAIDTTLYFASWGDLEFLIPPAKVEAWCAAVTNGYDFPFALCRHVGDSTVFDFTEPTRPTSRPVVPGAWQMLLPAAPIEARVARLVDWRAREAQSSVAHFDVTLELDRGAAEGVAVGLSMFAAPPPNWNQRRGRIESVDEHSARLVLLATEDQRAWAESLVGTTVSTLHPLAPRPSR